MLLSTLGIIIIIALFITLQNLSPLEKKRSAAEKNNNTRHRRRRNAVTVLSFRSEEELLLLLHATQPPAKHSYREFKHSNAPKNIGYTCKTGMAQSAKETDGFAASSNKKEVSGSVGNVVLQTNSLKNLLAKDPKQRKAAHIGNIRQLLIKNDFFLKLDNLKRRLFCKAILYHSLSSGQHLFDEGRRAEKIYIIQKGLCKVTFQSRDIRTVGPGDVLGEACVLDESAYHETVIAESSKVEAIVLLKKDYFDICDERRKSK